MAQEIKYVPKREVKEYKKEMQDFLIQISKKFKEEGLYYFNVGLVGSAKRNLVLRKGDSVYDVDFQLFLINNSVDADYRENIFDKIQEKKNSLEGSWKIENSHSVITIRKVDDNGTVSKSFDVVLTRKNNGIEKAVLDKNKNQYIWNQVSWSEKHYYKRNKIKGHQQWTYLRNQYKNLRENEWDKSKEDKKPSISLFVEAVNNTYEKFHNKKQG